MSIFYHKVVYFKLLAKKRKGDKINDVNDYKRGERL